VRLSGLCDISYFVIKFYTPWFFLCKPPRTSRVSYQNTFCLGIRSSQPCHAPHAPSILLLICSLLRVVHVYILASKVSRIKLLDLVSRITLFTLTIQPHGKQDSNPNLNGCSATNFGRLCGAPLRGRCAAYNASKAAKRSHSKAGCRLAVPHARPC
jgi:hypothetical protein